MVGQVGVDGPHAVSLVEPILDDVPDPVPVHLHVMAVTIALETRWKNNCATSSHALVRNEVALYHCFLYYPFLSISLRFVSSSYKSEDFVLLSGFSLSPN